MNNSDDFNMEDVVYHGINTNSLLHLSWKVTNTCNYNCSYCFGSGQYYKNLKSTEYTNLEDLKKIADKIFSLHNSTFDIILSGGEPTLHPHLISFLNYVSTFNKRIIIRIVTNGSKSISFFEELLSIDNIEFYIHNSIHLEFYNIEHTKELIKCCNRHKVPINLLLMFNPEKRKECDIFMEQCLSFRKDYFFDIRIDELRLGENFDTLDERYIEEDFIWSKQEKNRFDKIAKTKPLPKDWGWNLEEIRDFHYKLNDGSTRKIPHSIAFRTGKKKFKDFYCCGGLNLINVQDTLQYSGGLCQLFKKVGSFKDSYIDFLELSKPIKCTLESCGCATNDIIPKFRCQREAKDYVNKYLAENLQQVLHGMQSKNNAKLNSLLEAVAWRIPIKKLRDKFRKRFDL